MATNTGSDYTVDQYDRDVLHHKQAMEKAEADRRFRAVSERHETYRIVGGFVSAAVVILGIFGGWLWNHNQPADPYKPDSNIVREQNCIDRGGAWIPEDLLTTEHGLCVFPGKEIAGTS